MSIHDLHKAPIPFDRLTELANEMREVTETPENADVKGIICLSSEDQGGIVMFGFEDSTEAIAQLLLHIKAIFNSEDKEFGVMTDQGFMVI
jgi:hypothetical protein